MGSPCKPHIPMYVFVVMFSVLVFNSSSILALVCVLFSSISPLCLDLLLHFALFFFVVSFLLCFCFVLVFFIYNMFLSTPGGPHQRTFSC